MTEQPFASVGEQTGMEAELQSLVPYLFVRRFVYPTGLLVVTVTVICTVLGISWTTKAAAAFLVVLAVLLGRVAGTFASVERTMRDSLIHRMQQHADAAQAVRNLQSAVALTSTSGRGFPPGYEGAPEMLRVAEAQSAKLNDEIETVVADCNEVLADARSYHEEARGTEQSFYVASALLALFG